MLGERAVQIKCNQPNFHGINLSFLSIRAVGAINYFRIAVTGPIRPVGGSGK